MADGTDITISAWPKEAARLAHHFEPHSALPLRVGFSDSPPLAVRLGNSAAPIPIEMRMLLAAPRAIPICLSLCEAICADSDYVIALTLFDRPVLSIRLRGRTRLTTEI